MRRIFIATLMAWAILLVGASGRVQYNVVNSSGTLPTCTGDGGLYVKTGGSSGLYWCLGGAWEGPAVEGGGSGTVYDRIGFVFDGGGEDVPTGPSAVNRFPQVNVTIIRVTLAADVSCNALVDIWATTWSNSAYPTNSNSITGGNEPELTSDLAFDDGTLTSWDTTMVAGDAVIANVDSNTGCGHLVLMIDYSYLS